MKNLLTRAIRSGEVKASDLSRSIAQNADQLTFIGQARFKPWNGVGVDMARNGCLLPGSACIFLRKENVTWWKNLETDPQCFFPPIYQTILCAIKINIKLILREGVFNKTAEGVIVNLTSFFLLTVVINLPIICGNTTMDYFLCYVICCRLPFTAIEVSFDPLRTKEMWKGFIYRPLRNLAKKNRC